MTSGLRVETSRKRGHKRIRFKVIVTVTRTIEPNQSRALSNSDHNIWALQDDIKARRNEKVRSLAYWHIAFVMACQAA